MQISFVFRGSIKSNIMYQVANNHRDEIIKLLSLIQELPNKDLKTVNSKRKAKILIKKLSNAKPYKI